MDPASIRTNNPGAQWMGPIAKEFGATSKIDLPGGNNAAVFDDPEAGAAAQFALWGRRYSGIPLSAAISKWSGGNSVPAYTDFMTRQTGLSPDTVLTPEFLAGPGGLALAKAQAHWEAGRSYPMTDEQWARGQARAFGQPMPAATASLAPAAPSVAPAVALAQAQAPSAPYFAGAAQAPAAETTPQAAPGGGASALAQLGQGLLAPKAPAAPTPLQLPPAFRPRIGQLKSIATLKPTLFFPRG